MCLGDVVLSVHNNHGYSPISCEEDPRLVRFKFFDGPSFLEGDVGLWRCVLPRRLLILALNSDVTLGETKANLFYWCYIFPFGGCMGTTANLDPLALERWLHFHGRGTGHVDNPLATGVINAFVVTPVVDGPVVVVDVGVIVDECLTYCMWLLWFEQIPPNNVYAAVY